LHAKVRRYFFATVFFVSYFFSCVNFVSLNFITTPSLVSSSRAAVSNVAMDPISMMEKASYVLVGKVENIESHWDEESGSIYTYVKVYVEERIKGSIQDEYVVIKHKGGEVGNIGLWVSGEPCFLLGEKVEVYLKLEETGEFTVIDGWKGKVSLSSPASSGFSYSGIHWGANDLPVPYYINEDCTSQELQAVQASFQTWEDDLESSMDYTYMGTTTLSGESLNGYNVVSWQPIDGPSGTLAETFYWYNPSTKLLIEFDIVFDVNETWSTTGEPGKYDVQNVGTHEVGHTLMLEDLYDSADSEQTMYGYSSPGETKKRTLEAGDLAGLRYIYPMSKSMYTITSSPSGLQIEVDGTTYTSPQSFEWAQGSTHTINVPSNQSGDANTRYIFTGWSDGGAQQHQITIGASSVTITANYLVQYFVTLQTQGLKPDYPATINFTQLKASKASSIYDSWSDWCDSGSTLTINSYVMKDEGQRWCTHNTASWEVNSALAETVNYVLQYQISMVFQTYDQAITLQPMYVQILGSSPNNTFVTLESYSEIWLDNVTWTLKQVLWRNSNIVLNGSSANLTPKYKWTITCRVYPISFNASFKNFKGSELTENPSSFTLQFPNGTISGQLNPSNAYYLQNGTTQWESIIWQGVEVVPPDAYFDATNGNPMVNCLIYDFVVKVSDLFGLPVPSAQVSAKLSNGKTVNTQAGLDGVAVIQMAPQGTFTASISYLTQTAKVSGDVAKSASTPVKVNLTIGLFALLLLSAPCVLVVVLAVFLWRKSRRSQKQNSTF
jgi:hypothetical protein